MLKKIYATSTEDVLVPVEATISGVQLDPTTDVVAMAFIPVDQEKPLTGDWKVAGWETDPTGAQPRYYARATIGPGGVIALTGGGTRYGVYVRITDSPEVPVLRSPTDLLIA